MKEPQDQGVTDAGGRVDEEVLAAETVEARRAITRSRVRVDRDGYFMNLAIAVRERANCLGSRVGAVLVYEKRVIATGYNGTPENMPNCDEGGCDRCANREKYGKGKSYDVCICVHAEQNCLLSAARHGITVRGSTLYTTVRPCFGCTKELLQAQIQAVYFLHEWAPPAELQAEYDKLLYRVPKGVRRLDMIDPDQTWALPSDSVVPGDTGHAIP